MPKTNKANEANLRTTKLPPDSNRVAEITAKLVDSLVGFMGVQDQYTKLEEAVREGIKSLRLACGNDKLGKARFGVKVKDMGKALVEKGFSRQRVSDVFKKFGIQRRSSSKKAAIFKDEEINAGSDAILAFSWIASEKDAVRQADKAVKFASAVWRNLQKIAKETRK